MLRGKPNLFSKRDIAACAFSFAATPVLESEDVTALSTAAGQDTATALRAAANKEAVRASALDLGRLVGTFRCHFVFLKK